MEFQTGELPTLKSLITSGRVPAKDQDAYGQTVLFYAVQRAADSEAAELASLIIGSTSPEVARLTDHLSQSALFYAAKAGNLATARLLLAAGCRADAPDSYGQVPLFYAAREGRTKFVAAEEFLRTLGMVDATGQTALFYAAREGHREICRILLERAPRQMHHRDAEGKRPAHFARSRGFAELAEFLDSQPEQSDGRQRCRLVSPEGALSEDQLLNFEREFPEVAVWLARQGPVSRKPATPSMVSPRAPPPIVKKRSTVGDWETPAKRLLADLGRRQEADIFMRPVDPVKHMCPDYPQVISRPMDFGTIASRLRANQYLGFSDFRADVDLVFANCRQYNAEGTLPRLLCQRTEDWLLAKLTRLEPSPALATSPGSAASFK